MWITNKDGVTGWDSGNHELRIARLDAKAPRTSRGTPRRWAVWHVGTGAELSVMKDKGEARRWCRWWTVTQWARGITSPGFRVQLAKTNG